MLKTWWLAARPASLPKVALPTIAGLALGYAQTGELRLALAVVAFLLAWFDQVVIIFINDYADADADTLHAKKYPELIDPRVIPNGWLTRAQVLFAGMFFAALMLTLSAMAGLYLERPLAPVLVVLALFLIWAYSCPPLRINYRGFGEVLEAVGVGMVLPLIGFYLYTGSTDLPVYAILPLVFAAFASASSSGIKHMPADRESGKKTISVLFGAGPARALALVALAGSIVYSAVFTLLGHYHWISAAFTVLIPALFFAITVRHLNTADHHDLASLKTFKGALHKAIYTINTGLVLSFLLR